MHRKQLPVAVVAALTAVPAVITPAITARMRFPALGGVPVGITHAITKRSKIAVPSGIAKSTDQESSQGLSCFLYSALDSHLVLAICTNSDDMLDAAAIS